MHFSKEYHGTETRSNVYKFRRNHHHSATAAVLIASSLAWKFIKSSASSTNEPYGGTTYPDRL